MRDAGAVERHRAGGSAGRRAGSVVEEGEVCIASRNYGIHFACERCFIVDRASGRDRSHYSLLRVMNFGREAGACFGYREWLADRRSTFVVGIAGDRSLEVVGACGKRGRVIRSRIASAEIWAPRGSDRRRTTLARRFIEGEGDRAGRDDRVDLPGHMRGVVDDRAESRACDRSVLIVVDGRRDRELSFVDGEWFRIACCSDIVAIRGDRSLVGEAACTKRSGAYGRRIEARFRRAVCDRASVEHEADRRNGEPSDSPGHGRVVMRCGAERYVRAIGDDRIGSIVNCGRD